MSHYWHLATKVPSTSLGASGGVIAIMMAYICMNPHAQLSLIFLPMFPFAAAKVVPAYMAFEAIGLTGIWRRLFGLRFDHAAHLAGGLFGYGYAQWLQQRYTNRNRIQR